MGKRKSGPSSAAALVIVQVELAGAVMSKPGQKPPRTRLRPSNHWAPTRIGIQSHGHSIFFDVPLGSNCGAGVAGGRRDKTAPKRGGGRDSQLGFSGSDGDGMLPLPLPPPPAPAGHPIANRSPKRWHDHWNGLKINLGSGSGAPIVPPCPYQLVVRGRCRCWPGRPLGYSLRRGGVSNPVAGRGGWEAD